MEKDKVYISGAIAHYNIDERKGAFANAEQNLRNMGFSPVNPFKNGLPDGPIGESTCGRISPYFWIVSISIC